MPFQYQPFANPYVETIGNLMRAGPEAQARAALAIGQAQAQGAVQSGNAWAGAIQNVGQAAAGAAGQIAQERMQAPIRAQEAQIRAQQIGAGQRAAVAADRLAATRQQVNGLLNDPDVLNPDGTFNLQGMASKMQARAGATVGPQEAPDMTAIAGLLEPINAGITQARESQRVYAEHQTNALARLASGVLTLGAPTAAQPQGQYAEYAAAGVAAAIKAGLMTQAQGDQFLAQVHENPEFALKSAAARSTVAPIKVGEKDRLVSGVDPTQTVLPAQADPADAFKGAYTINGQRFNANGTPIGPPVPAQVPPAAAQTHTMRLPGVGDVPVDYIPNKDGSGGTWKYQGRDVTGDVRAIPPASVTIRNDTAAALAKLPAWALDDSRPAGGDANTMDQTIMRTPNGLYQDAVTLIQTGAYPNMGRSTDARGQALRAAIDAKVGAIAAASGMDVPQLRSFFKSNQASLTQQQKLFDAASSNIATADRNADLLEKALEKMPDTGSPLLNQPLRTFQTRVMGNTAMAPIGTYLASVQNEYGKLINSASGTNAALTDSARHEAQNLLDPNASVASMIESIRALKAEGGNRLLSTGDQIKAIQARMSIGGGAAPPAVSAAAPVLPPVPAGQMRAFDPAGQPHLAPVGTPVPPGWTVR